MPSCARACLLSVLLLNTVHVWGMEPTLHERVAPACVEVLVRGQLAGSAWFATGDGYIVTARHIVRLARKKGQIEVVLPSGKRIAARGVATDPLRDLALLKVEPGDQPYASLEVAEHLPDVGQQVFLFGQMMFRHGLLLPGTVASDRPVFEYLPDQECYARVVPVAPALVAGASGGPWVDRHGRVVGNQVSTLALGDSPVGLSFMAELEGIRRLVREKTTLPVTTLGLAVEELWEKPAQHIARFPEGTSGVVPAIIHPDGPSAEAGLNKQMVIVAVDGQPVRLRDDLLGYVTGKQPGARVTLTVIDADKNERREIQVELRRLREGK